MSGEKKKHKKNTDEVHEPIQEEVQIENNTDERDLKIEQLENQLKRAVADYINLGRRVEEEKREVILFANRELLLSLLPAFDTLFLAAKFSQDQGVQLTAKHILEVLKSVGVEKIKTIGEKFNPELMEAVETVDGEEGKVIEETKSGFTLYGKLLSPAVVKVGSAKQN